jgi:hypothetical protein
MEWRFATLPSLQMPGETASDTSELMGGQARLRILILPVPAGTRTRRSLTAYFELRNGYERTSSDVSQ